MKRRLGRLAVAVATTTAVLAVFAGPASALEVPSLLGLLPVQSEPQPVTPTAVSPIGNVLDFLGLSEQEPVADGVTTTTTPTTTTTAPTTTSSSTTSTSTVLVPDLLGVDLTPATATPSVTTTTQTPIDATRLLFPSTITPATTTTVPPLELAENLATTVIAQVTPTVSQLTSRIMTPQISTILGSGFQGVSSALGMAAGA